jgi:hypothetical protein
MKYLILTSVNKYKIIYLFIILISCKNNTEYQRIEQLKVCLSKLCRVDAENLRGRNILFILQTDLCSSCVWSQMLLVDSISKRCKISVIMSQNEEIYTLFKENCTIYVDTGRVIQKSGMASGYNEIVDFNDSTVVFHEKFTTSGLKKIRQWFLK